MHPVLTDDTRYRYSPPTWTNAVSNFKLFGSTKALLDVSPWCSWRFPGRRFGSFLETRTDKKRDLFDYGLRLAKLHRAVSFFHALYCALIR
jgi:hypothetical protein